VSYAGDERVRARLTAAHRLGLDLTTSSPVLAQVWRDGRRQALLARLVTATRVDAPDEAAARRAGELLRKSATTDVVDALLVGLVRDGDTILTSERDDIERLLVAAGTLATIVPV
jgi:hypothetical protein